MGLGGGKFSSQIGEGRGREQRGGAGQEQDLLHGGFLYVTKRIGAPGYFRTPEPYSSSATCQRLQAAQILAQFLGLRAGGRDGILVVIRLDHRAVEAQAAIGPGGRG